MFRIHRPAEFGRGECILPPAPGPYRGRRQVRPGARLAVLFALMIAGVGIGGCRTEPNPRAKLEPAAVSPTIERSRADRLRVHPDVPRGASFVAGWSVGLRPIRYEVHGAGDDVVVIIATIHGDEPAGTPLVRRLSAHLRQNPELVAGRRVVLVPVANPDGMAAATRWNSRGVDLNRNYPAKNFRATARHGLAALSEPESRVLLDVLTTFRPARVLSIHQPLSCIDYDGTAADLAYAIARFTDLPVKKLGGRSGSLGSYVSRDLQIPIVTLELPGNASRLRESALWHVYRDVLLAFILYPESPEIDTARVFAGS